MKLHLGDCLDILKTMRVEKDLEYFKIAEARIEV
jgi:hypothetical protein